MKVSFYFCLSGMCFLVAFLLLMSGVRRQEETLAARIAPAVLRFHVLANSDSPEDQAIKLQVKDLLLKEIREGAGDAAQNKEELCRYISENRHELETAAENYMAECGVSYSARIRLETCEFPMRTYGDLTFPAGTYDAVRVLWETAREKISGAFFIHPYAIQTVSMQKCRRIPKNSSKRFFQKRILKRS